MPKQWRHTSPRDAWARRSAAAQLPQRIGPKAKTSRPHCGQRASPDSDSEGFEMSAALVTRVRQDQDPILDGTPPAFPRTESLQSMFDSMYRSYSVRCAMPNLVFCYVFARSRVFVYVHPLQTGRGLVSRRRPAAAGSMSHSQKHVGLVRVQDETLHGCEAQIATLCRTKPCAVATRTSVRWRCAGRSLARPRSFSSANIGQFAVNVTPASPTVLPPHSSSRL